MHARLIAQFLSERFGQSFVIDNRPGSGTNIATEAVAHAPADGYTLLLIVNANTVNVTLYDKLGFDFRRDIAPVASISRVPLVVTVNLSVPAMTMGEFISYAKANPGKVNMGSTGNGGTPHLAGELFKMMAGLDMVHTPFRGPDAAQAGLVDGHAQVMFSILPEAIDNLRAGKLRALATATADRIETFPDLPPVAAFVPGYEASTWNGVGAPSNTPIELLDQLNAAVNAALADPKIKARLTELGSAALPGSRSEFQNFIATETEKWGKVVRFAKLKAA